MALNTTLYRVLSMGREVVAIDFSFQLNGAGEPTMVSGTGAAIELLDVSRTTTGTFQIDLAGSTSASEVLWVDSDVFPQSTSARSLGTKWVGNYGPTGWGGATIVVLSGTSTTAVDATDGRVHGVAWVRHKEEGY